MSKYYTVLRKSSTYSGTDEFKTLFSVFWYVWSFMTFRNRRLCKYTFTIEQRDGYELVEKRELKRLKRKYENA